MRNNLFICFILIFFLTACGRESNIIPYDVKLNTESEVSVGSNTSDSVRVKFISENEKICVSIYGEVANPGIYMLSPGTRVYEAINLAGGITQEADVSSLNLVAHLDEDGRIFVPAKDSGGETDNSLTGSEGTRININTASSQELTSLSGIGPSKAADIVSYREKKGPFKSIEEIMEVPGIGTATFEKIRDEIRVD